MGVWEVLLHKPYLDVACAVQLLGETFIPEKMTTGSCRVCNPRTSGLPSPVLLMKTTRILLTNKSETRQLGGSGGRGHQNMT